MDSKDIDVTYDFQRDTPPGRDPDTWSPTLALYHQLLWSKPLPSGQVFELAATNPPIYLHHRSQAGEFWLSSDTVIPTFTRDTPIPHIIDQVPPQDCDSFYRLAYTIGGMMVFPAVRVENHMTINQQRGLNRGIRDRFDLTIECIRRYYCNETSPLKTTLARYADFFGLFRDFRGYVEFFFLQDIVTEDFSAVKFFSPFDDFPTAPLPRSVSEYMEYRRRAMNFINARNRRILQNFGSP